MNKDLELIAELASLQNEKKMIDYKLSVLGKFRLILKRQLKNRLSVINQRLLELEK